MPLITDYQHVKNTYREAAQLGAGLPVFCAEDRETLEAILASVGMNMGDVVKCTVFLSDLANFDKMNAVYKTHVVTPPPARSTVQVAALPHDALVEIEAIARKSN